MEKQIAKLTYWLGIGSTFLALVLRALVAAGIWSAPNITQSNKIPISYWSFFDGAALMFGIAIASSLVALIDAQGKHGAAHVYKVSPMPDEIPVSQEAQDSDNDRRNPEAPIIPHSPEASHKKSNADIKAHSAREYVYQPFRAIRVFFVKAWTHKPSSNAWMALASIVMAGATCLLTYYARSQWKIIGDQLYEIGANGKDERRAQWAHIDIPQQLQIRITVENGKVTFWTPEITMVNNGSTGTYNTVETVSVSGPRPELPEACKLPEDGTPQHSDIGPHEAELFDTEPIPIAAIQAIQTGSHIYIHGGATYRDIFQFYGSIKHGATRHLREFCYELRLDSQMGNVTSPSYIPPKSLVLHGSRNCTDGDCPDYTVKIKTWDPR